MRRTKIIATLGPATDKGGMLERLFDAGVDVFRLNYSHQTQGHHEQRIIRLRELSLQRKRAVGVIADLQGPKIRIEHFADGKVQLKEGASFTIDTELSVNAGDEKHVGVSYKNLPRDVRAGNTLLIDDGRIVLRVKAIHHHAVECEVIAGGELSDNKGINLQGGGLTADALTTKDSNDLEHAVRIGADFIAISFPRRADDIHKARAMLKALDGRASIIAKIERAEALDDIEAIIEASDAIMIARGDLGVEIGDAGLPPVQKRLIQLARSRDRAVITATQMMQSMIEHQMPTRAEVFDVANAVLDGTDAVMLSGETSIGKYPEMAVLAMSRICEETEKQRSIRVSDHRINQRFEEIDEAIAMSTMYAANHIGAKAIAALTETGSTCLWMSRISSGIPIFAFTRHETTRRRVSLYRGVYPIKFDITHTDPLAVNREIIDELMARKIVNKGDYVIITKGDLRGRKGGTNNMKIIRAGESTEHDI
ncbi:MAG: pyruvate kinase [Gammaproteobacteria bacterium RBG_16_51_14]|nr:MAG: pyruvate kinase [Gammaproteobacteria bacterium RBG_16_51_14]